MKRQTFKYPGNAALQRLLEKHNCPTPFHVVLFRFLGEIASLDFGARPLKIVESFWDDDLPVPSRSPYLGIPRAIIRHHAPTTSDTLMWCS